MNVIRAEKKEKSTVELEIQVGAEEFEAALDRAYRKNRGKINVPGFRKGKAPRKIIEGMYGAGVFYEDAINDLYPGVYAQAIEEQKLDDVGYPKMEIVNVGKEGFTFKALVSVRPEAKISDYKGLTAPKAEVKITEEDINDELKPYIDRATRLVAVKRKAKKGDTAVIDFEGFMNGEPFEGGKGDNYSLELGSGAFIPGFEDKIIGMKAGEEAELNLTFPEDYLPELAGKEVMFKVKVDEVKESVKPELDDEFAKDVSEFETLEALRKDLSDKLTASRTERAQRDYEEAVMSQLTSKLEADIPDAMVEVQLDKMMDEYSMRLANQGIGLEDYLRMVGMNVETLRASARISAEKQVKVELALTAVAKAEGFQISDEEAEEEYSRLSEQYKMEMDKVKAAVDDKMLRQDLLLRKASDFVLENALVGEAPKAEESKSTKKTTRKSTKKAEEKTEKAEKTEEGGEKPAKKTTRKSAKKAETEGKE